jgi:hypothetical protein
MQKLIASSLFLAVFNAQPEAQAQENQTNNFLQKICYDTE